jgi:drug/metabolite transporter (DMT)-like permease
VNARLMALPGVVLVAIAAAMWGFDPIIRKPLSHTTTATTIVFLEHVLLVLLTLPFLVGALRAMLRAGWRYVLCAVIIGAGSSALATILFTEALFHSDFITPVVVQKFQPLIAIAGAALILGERPRPRFLWFFVPAIVGFYLVSMNDPLEPTLEGMIPILQATAAAALWALGTVLGRYMSRELEFQQILTLRFFFGLAGSAIALAVMNVPAWAGWHDFAWIALLAITTGLVSLTFYYIGLHKTPAMLASLAELTYPVIAVIAGIYAYDAHLKWSQWLGAAIIVATVTLLPFQRRRSMVEVVPRDAALAPT